MTDYHAPSDLVLVYDTDDMLVGHLWYSTFLKIHDNPLEFRLEYSKWNCPENVEEWEAHHELG